MNADQVVTDVVREEASEGDNRSSADSPRKAVFERKSQRIIAAQAERKLKAQQRDSLGRLAQLFDSYEFRDEVLFSATLRRRPKELAACLNEPQWATLQELDLVSLDLPDLIGKTGAFFNSLPLLHTVKNLSLRLVPEVPCPRITTVSLPQLDAGKLAQTFPALRSLTFDFLVAPLPFWGHPFVEALESVTIRELTWSRGVLTTGRGFVHDAFLEWVEHGPPLHRLELKEDELMSSGELYALRELLAAARKRGAEVIVMPPSDTELRSPRRHHWDY